MSNGIAYQNKDIEFKRVYANEMRMDNLFLLEDNTLALVDYESEDKLKNRIKYVNYIGRVMEKYQKEGFGVPNIRMIVIYTGDVEKANSVLETECITLRMEQVFVSKLPTEEIYQTVSHKLDKKKPLTEQELTQLTILPLAEKGKENKQRRIKQVVELAKQIENEDEQTFVLTGLLVSSDKFIDREYAEIIRRCLGMTKVFQIIEEEGIEKGKINTFLLLYHDGTLDKDTCAKKLNISTKEFEQLLKENEETNH